MRKQFQDAKESSRKLAAEDEFLRLVPFHGIFLFLYL
jgi:hypothetical protein